MNLFNKKTTVDIEKNRIPILNKVVRKEGEITGDMSVDEVAEIVSERMMEVVRKQMQIVQAGASQQKK
ncbi:MAG: hypothetical protein RL007_1196 [Bacteroidota bacterium]|jgi:hypothetical protein